MEQTRIFLDVPEQFYELPADGITDWIQIFPRPGIYNHPGYGQLEITPAKLQRMADSFKQRVYQEHIPVDAEHQTKLSGALGYYREVEARDDGLFARIALTDRGKKLVGEDRFKYFSAELWPTWSAPEGGEHKDVLIGGAFTSRPFFKDTVQRPIAASELEAQEFMASGQPRDDHGKWTKGGGGRGAQIAHSNQTHRSISTNGDVNISKGGGPVLKAGGKSYDLGKPSAMNGGRVVSLRARSEDGAVHALERGADGQFRHTSTSDGYTISHISKSGQSPFGKGKIDASGQHVDADIAKALNSYVSSQGFAEQNDESTIIPQAGKHEEQTMTENAQAFTELQERYGELESKHTELSQKYSELETQNKALSAEASAAKKESESYSERIAALENAARHKRFTDLVTGHGGAGDGQHWFGEPEQHVSLLTQLAEAFGEGSDAFKSYVAQQEKTASAVAASVQRSDGGRSPLPAESGIQHKFDAAVAERMKANPALSRPQALAEVIRTNPQLYSEYTSARPTSKNKE